MLVARPLAAAPGSGRGVIDHGQLPQGEHQLHVHGRIDARQRLAAADAADSLRRPRPGRVDAEGAVTPAQRRA
jgi:hypothetical protein